MNAFGRFVKRSTIGVRSFSHAATPEQLHKEVKKWWQISAFGVTFTLLAGTWILSHEEHLPKMPQDLPYMRIRAKPFPWSDKACNDCGLFEMDCWEECRKQQKN